MAFITAFPKVVLTHIIEKEFLLNRKARFWILTDFTTVYHLNHYLQNTTKINASKISSSSSTSDLFNLPFFYSIEFLTLIIKYIGEHSCIIEPDENQSQNYFTYLMNHQTAQEILFE